MKGRHFSSSIFLFRTAAMALPAETAPTSTWPLPPTQYINLYTDENIRRGRAPKPPLPIHNEYTMFGVPFNADDSIIRPLESQVS